MNSSTTLDYYNQNAQSFALGTVSVDFHETQDRFLKLLDKGSLVLDFGTDIYWILAVVQEEIQNIFWNTVCM